MKAAHLSLAAMIVSSTAAQILLKLAAEHHLAWGENLISYAVNPWLWASMCALGAGMLFWISTLRSMDLASAYPWTALIYLFTPMLSVLIFGDDLTARYALGMLFIIGGIFLTSRGVVQANEL